MRKKTPSPATVISIIALVFAVAGTALASVATVSVLSKKERKQTRNIADAEIGKAAPGLSVANATNAGNAVNATNAGNADTVDRRHATCPGGYLAIAGVCYESSSRASANWAFASPDCADENASLPTVGQLKLALDELNPSGSEWTDGLQSDGSSINAQTVTPSGSVGIVDNTSLRPYRCVIPLVR
jgi:hypothetical protein